MLWLTALVINEVAQMSGDSGWVELYNGSGSVVDLNGYVLRTSAGTFTLSGVMAGGEYRIFYLRFRSHGDSVVLYRGDSRVDVYRWTSLPDRGSMGRMPDGTGDFRFFVVPTPNRANELPSSLDEQSWGRIKALFGPGKRR
ncbi:MAG: lamin tail domain-containing protein [Thermotogae bacterium]|nr:lamin tail domain-containing protein [Thermotogota bacterium]